MADYIIRFLPAYVAMIISLGGLGVSLIVKFNDAKHLKIDIKRLEEWLERVDKKLDANAERLSFLEGKIATDK